jgi:hypothetical protein
MAAHRARRRPVRTRASRDYVAEKGQLERATVELFLPLYNAHYGREFRIAEMRDRPDVLLEAEDGSRLGVELTVVGYPNAEGEHSSGARNEIAFLLGRVRADHAEGQVFSCLIGELNKRLAEKATTFASVVQDYPIVLATRSASPMWSLSDFELARADIHVSRMLLISARVIGYS